MKRSAVERKYIPESNQINVNERPSLRPIRHSASKTARLNFKQSGFTLVELLVVIAIIALLMAILLPALARARELGKRAVCQNQMKHLAIAWYLYCDDNKEKLPYGNIWWSWNWGAKAGPCFVEPVHAQHTTPMTRPLSKIRPSPPAILICRTGSTLSRRARFGVMSRIIRFTSAPSPTKARRQHTKCLNR